MSNPNTMAHQRPPYQSRPSGSANAFSPSFPQAPSPNSVNFPSPVQSSSSLGYPQGLANKRPRLSSDAPSSYASPAFAMSQEMSNGSPVGGMITNGGMVAPAPPGSMGPPSRPADKGTDIRTLEDTLSGTGVNIDEEERNLTSGSFSSLDPPTAASSFQTQYPSFGTTSAGGSFDRPSSAGRQDSFYPASGDHYLAPSPADDLTPQEWQLREDAEEDWQAARESQHPLWKSFLQGEPVEHRLINKSYEHGIKTSREGLYFATTSQRPPQRTQVNGLDGAKQIIHQGETILSTQNGDVLGDIMKLVSLAAKERVAGVLDASARLARERRIHSRGLVPDEWKSVAALPPTTPASAEAVGSPGRAASLKRTHSQANDGESVDTAASKISPMVEMIRKSAEAARAAEEARIAKRARRKGSAAADPSHSALAAVPSGAEITNALLAESDKRITKKDRKILDSKFTEVQQHKSANEAARMATAGSFGGGKKKQYAWLTGGTTTPKPGSLSSTTAKTNAASSSSPASNANRSSALSKHKQFGQFDEASEPGIQARDVLLVLESDGRAPRSLLKGYNAPER